MVLEAAGWINAAPVDRTGRLRHIFFGAPDDLVLGAQVGRLLADRPELHGVTVPAEPEGTTP